jgi:hypothetical protein
VKKGMIAITLLAVLAALAEAQPIGLNVGEPFTKARAKLYVDGWRADPLAHVATGEYMGLDRQLVQSGYAEVDYCSAGKSYCVFQYTKGQECLRLRTQGEQIQAMKVERWSSECRERGINEEANLLPSDVRYIAQWRNDCENFGQCKGVDDFLLKLKKKYARDAAVMKVLRSYDNPVDVKQSFQK